MLVQVRPGSEHAPSPTVGEVGEAMAEPVPSEEPPPPRTSPERTDTPRTGRPHEEIDQELRVEVAQLRRAMQTRPTIDQAIGVLIGRFGLSPEAAWNVLVKTSQNTNTKVHILADDLVGAGQADALPKAVRKQLAAAVAEAKASPPSGG